MVDVDYLSRMHNGLVRAHIVVANTFALADRSTQPCAYKEEIWGELLKKGKYSFKSSWRKRAVVQETTISHVRKRPALVAYSHHQHRSVSPVQVLLTNTTAVMVNKWKLGSSDGISNSNELQQVQWLSINRHHALNTLMEQHYLVQPLVHYVVTVDLLDTRLSDFTAITEKIKVPS